MRHGWNARARIAAAMMLLAGGWGRAQTIEVTNLADPAKRAAFVQQLQFESSRRKIEAWRHAQQEGWATRFEKNGRVFELMAIEDGRVYTYATTNVNAAISTAANLIRNVSPYDVNGLGWTVGLWDGGAARATHQEFAGGRVTVKDGAGAIDHATHVCGTIGAAGVVPAALGMAPSVKVDSYEWTNDTSEMASRAMAVAGEADKIQISSHSYGYLSGWEYGYSPPRWYGTWGNRESDNFGLYETVTRQWDIVCYNAPYYLPFKATNNDRDDPAPSSGADFQYFNGFTWTTKSYNPATDPYSDGYDNGGFDTIPYVGTAKNVMTIGAVNDAVSGGTRYVPGASIAAFSCWGPTDDGRVKPDIMTNGVGLYSSTAGSSSAYSSFSGTSMSTPNASGTAVLLVDYYGRQFPGQFMRASTLKALLIHTADDLNNAGPDYRTGWGLMNAKAAADVIQAQSDRPSAQYITEGFLNPAHQNDAYSLTWNGTTPIRATLCWTDPAAGALSGLDNPSRRLVNDLDVRIVGPGGSPTYFPYVLNPASPASLATTGDNDRDNVEQVYIAAPPAQGTYTVQVSYKAPLTNGVQYYSLILTGQGPSPVGTIALDADRHACSATVTVEVTDGDLVGTGSVPVTVTTSGGDSENVVLTETPASSAVFIGTIAAAPGVAAPGNGTLDVADGQTIVASYVDASHGGAGQQTVQDTADVDCQPPEIMNVDVADVTGTTATITFDTNEIATVKVRSGQECGVFTQTEVGLGPNVTHQVQLAGLAAGTSYHFVVDATDIAGNAATDDNGGACFAFTTLEQPDYFAEQFSSLDNDLDYAMLTFSPDGSGDFYRACRVPAAALPVDPSGGTNLGLSDDSYATVTLGGGAKVYLYGVGYSTIHVGSNGYITFTGGDVDVTETLADHFNQPRVSGHFDDLDPGAIGSVVLQQLPDRVVVTYQNVPEWNTTNSNTFQIEMFFVGVIRVTYQRMDAGDGLAGLSKGTGLQPDFIESDLTAYAACPNPADLDGDGDVDVGDYAQFQACFNGPGSPPTAICTVVADFAGDGDVDVDDFTAFQLCFNGPANPPASSCPF